jgi:hypothetical protein
MAKDTRTAAQDKTLNAALRYAGLGYTVFPAELPSKHPCKAGRFSNGERWGATKDLKQIERDFKKWPDAAVCIPTGIENGFFVVEADTPEGHDVDGIANLQKLIDGREWPETRMARSPTGSIHYYFAYPDQGRIRNRTGEYAIAPGVDVLGEGGMVVCPPSLKPDVGEYIWLNGNGFEQAPQWLLNLVIIKKRKRSAIEDDDIEINVDKVIAALKAATNDNVCEDLWYKIMAAAWRGSNGDQDAYNAFVEWSGRSPKHRARRTKDRWEAFEAEPPRDIGPGTLYAHANATAPGWREAMLAEAMATLLKQYAADVAASKAKGGSNAS